MRHRSDPDGAKHGNAFDGTSVLIAGGAPAERRKASSPPSSPANRLSYSESRHAELLNQQPSYNSIHRSAVTSPVVPQRDHSLNHPPDPNPNNKIIKDLAQSPSSAPPIRARAPPSPPQLPQYHNKNDRTGKGHYLVDLDVTILGDDSLIEPRSSPTATTSSSTSGYYASTSQPHRSSANDPQPRSPSSPSSSSRNNSMSYNHTNTSSVPQQQPLRTAHDLRVKDQAQSVQPIAVERVEADQGGDGPGARRFDTAEAHSNAPSDHPRPTVIAKARRTNNPPPNDRPQQQQQQQHPASSPTTGSSSSDIHRSSNPRNDSTPAPPSPRRQPSYHTPDETVFSFAVPGQQKGCGCVVQ